MRKPRLILYVLFLILLPTLFGCTGQSPAIDSSVKVTFTLPIDTEMFSKEAILTFTLWNADQLEIIDRIANCTVSYDAELQKEEIHCPEGVEYEEVAPEEIRIHVQEISDSVKIESGQLKVGERYRLAIAGLSNDNCNTTSANIEEVAQQADISLDDLRWATTEMACP